MKHLTISVSISLAIAFFAAGPVAAADLTCSIRPPKGAAPSALQGLAKVTEADARTAALAAFPVNSAEIIEAELEAERGCLIYSFDVRLAGKNGVEEVWVDAGSGQLLSRKHETPQHEAAEAADEMTESDQR